VGFFIGYIRKSEFFKQCFFDKRVLAVLTIGAISVSIINIPIFFSRNTMLAINLGSVIIPIVISIVFIYKMRVNPLIIILGIMIVSICAYSITFLDASYGVLANVPLLILLIFLCTLISVLVFFRQPYHAVPFAYTISSFGILIGADIARLPLILENNLVIGYIGGLGIFDLIFLTSLFSTALTLTIIYRFTAGSRITLPSKTLTKLNSHLQWPENLKISKFTKRLFAFLIDCGIQAAVLFSILITINIGLLIPFSDLFSGVYGFTIFWWAVTGHFIYFIILEWYLGQTVGKWFMKIKVTTLIPDKKNKQAINTNRDFLSIFTRNILRIIDSILFILNIFRLVQSSKRQRYGDLFAGTYVINNENFQIN
jgi:uncharacterized RDD family membrane protein YckC